MNHYTIFISDLHLSNSNPITTNLFLKFLAKIPPKIDALYILGDLFQYWVGDDDCSPFNEEIKTALKKFSQTVPVYLMPGNRDFLLGTKFAKESGCTSISDPCQIDLYDKKTLLTHGDILCTNDLKYRIFRSIIRIKWGLKIFLILPLKIRSWIASSIQKYFARKSRTCNPLKFQPQTEAIKKLLTKFDLEQIIHGHFHINEVKELLLNSQNVCRISVGEWNNQGSILIYFNDHNFKFVTLK